MAREIDILCDAARGGCAVVDRGSHVLWTPEELIEAARAGCYADEDSLDPEGADPGVSGPFPGCPQCCGQPADLTRYRLLGKTEHFAVFAPPGQGRMTRDR